MASTQIDRLGMIPLAPAGLVATAIAGGFTLSWNATTDATIGSYQVSVAPGAGQPFIDAIAVQSIAAPATGTSYAPGYGAAPVTVFVQAIGSGGASPTASLNVTPLSGITSIAALRGVTILTFPLSLCYVWGYSFVADGGGGWFTYDPAETTTADNGGTIIVDASGRRWYRQINGSPIVAKWFGATGTGTGNDAPAINAAIAYAQGCGGGDVLLSGGENGGTNNYLCTASVNITSAGITLRGASKQAVVLTFANGSGHGLVIGGQVAVTYGTTIRDMMIAGSGKTGGDLIHATNAGNMEMASVIASGFYNGIYLDTINNVILDKCELVSPVSGGSYAIKWYSLADGAHTSNVLELHSVTINCNSLGHDGLVVDGACQTLRVFGLGIIHAGYGVRFQNTQHNASGLYPQFVYAYDLEVDGVLHMALSIEGGREMHFFGGDFFNNNGAGPTDTDCVEILSDGAHSVVSSITFHGGRIGGAQHRGVVSFAKDVYFENVGIRDNSLAGSGLYPGVQLSNDGGTNGASTNVSFTGGKIGAAFGDQLYQTGIVADLNTFGTVINGVNFGNCKTQAIADNSGGLGNVTWKGCIDIDGSQMPDRMQILAADALTAAQVEGAFYINGTTHALRTFVGGALKTVTVT